MKIKKAKVYSGKWQSATIEGVDAIGVTCIIDMRGIRESRTSIKSKLESMGYPTDGVVLEKRDKSAFLDVVKGLEDRGILVKIDDPYAWVTYQTNSVELNDALGASGLQPVEVKAKAVVRFYKPGRGPRGGTVESDQPGLGDAVQALMEAEKDMARTSDVSGIIDRLVERIGDSCSMRRGGGVIFIPAPFYQDALKIQSFVRSLNGDNGFEIFPVPANADKKQSVWKNVTSEVASVLADLDRYGKEVISMVASQNTGETTNKRGQGRIDTALTTYDEIIGRVQMYADFLQMKAEGMVQAIEDKKKAFATAVMRGF